MFKRNQHKRIRDLGLGLGRFVRTAGRSLLAASLVLSPMTARSANAAILNSAQVSGSTPGGSTVTSPLANETVTTITGAPSMIITKSGVLNDDDGIGGVSAGDTILYTVTVQNTGNVSLGGVIANDPMAALTLTGGDTDSDNRIDIDETWTYTGSYTLTQGDVDTIGGGDGEIENTVTISTDQLPDDTAGTNVPLNINPSMDITKDGVLNDDDGTPGLSAGDTIDYSVTVTNTGNIRLTNVVVTDPLVTLTYQSGDTNSDNRLDVDEVWTYSGSTIVTQGDLDTLGGGDSDIDNTASVSADQLPSEDVSHELPIAPVSSLEIKKTATAAVQLFPTVYEYDYQLTVRNTGALTQTNFRVEDDLVSGVAPASLAAIQGVTVSGFAGPGGYNAGFDGNADQQLLTGDVQLAPGDIGLITITVRIDTGGQGINNLNTAYASSTLVTIPIPSDDPTSTPGDVNDTNPTAVDLPDTDGDGSPDSKEDTEPDRDGDGSSNSNDYDPTGYFYCQADGRILSGGLITVENLTAGGSQTGIGSSNGITIIRDGSDGSFQFHATQTGNFQLSYILPGTGIASTTRLTSGTLDVSSMLPDDPAVIGSSEYGSTGYLASFSAADNPFYTRFEIEAGDPAVFNNNIPLQFCGSPELSVEKSVVSGPTLQPGPSYQVTYQLDLEASGTEVVNDVQLVDDLAGVFGAGNYTIDNITLDAAPVGFTATIDPFYNGDANTALLTSGGSLDPGETLRVLLTVSVTVPDGIYTNSVTSNGTSPLDGSPIASSIDDAQISITNPTNVLIVEKTATPGSARIGDPVSYTITISNPTALDFNDIDIIDLIPNGMTYVKGSARVDGTKVNPVQGDAPRIRKSDKSLLSDHDDVPASGRELRWEGLSIAAGGSITVTLTLVVNASASSDEYINLAYVEDGLDGSRISNIAKARVRPEIDPVFECSDLIGRVFDDLDKDGYYDDDEPGLPGVRLATPNGLLIVTDKFGRYSIACGDIPDADIGSNFLMKLDTRTLPTGYRVTSENPRVVRLTRGKLTKLNFAAANLRLIRLELTDQSFVGGSTRPGGETLRSIGSLLSVLDEEPSALQLVYSKPGVDKSLARERLNGVETLIRKAWDSKSRTNALTTETRLVD